MTINAEAARLFRDCVLWHRPGSFRRAVAYTGVVMLATLALSPKRFLVDGSVLVDGHALASIELAMGRAYCGQPSSHSNTVRIPYDVRDDIDLRHVSLRELIVRKAGSLDAYCRSVNQPFVNNENSLMLLDTLMLRVWPSMSVSQLGEALHLVRIAAAAIFVLLLLDLGGSLALGFGTIVSSLWVLSMMPTQAYTNYPFLFAMVLVAAALYGFALKHGWTRSVQGTVVFGVAAGILSAFIVNMRTSYLPITVLFCGCFVIAELVRQERWRRLADRAWWSLALVGSFALGYIGLQ